MSIPDPTTPDPEAGPTGVPGLGRRAIRANAFWFRVTGIVAILAGALAIVLPLAATLAASLLVGVLLLVVGVSDLVRAFQIRFGMRSLGTVLLGVLSIAAGLVLLVFPLGGALTLTLVLIAYFLVEGVSRVVMAIECRDQPRWGLMLAGGLVSVVLAILIWAGLPGSAVWAIGLLVGVNMIVYGAILIALTAEPPAEA